MTTPMKTLFVLLLIAVIAGAFGWQHYQRSQKPTIQQRAAELAERSRDVAQEARDAVAAKVEDWNLTPESIKNELAKTGQVMRTRAITIGERIDDARIITVIKGKYVVERKLSSLAISVECRDGAVRLSGSVNSADQVAQAVALALKTNGVQSVVSKLSVKA